MKTPFTMLTKRLLAAALLWSVAGTVLAADFHLRAEAFPKTLPDGAAVTMWGFALDDDGDFSTIEHAPTVPGPLLTVPPGDSTLTIHLYNNLPQLNGADVPVSVVVPGQIAAANPVRNPDGRVRSFTHETPRLGTASYTWTGMKPGTYLYQSGTHPALQVQMGLYGALLKDAATREAYAGVPYDYEVILLLSEIDPVLHEKVALDDYGPGKSVTSTINYRPQYHLLNGEPFPSTSPGILGRGGPGERVLLRFLNAGLETHVPVLQGLDLSLVAEDGNRLPYAKRQYSVLLPAGKTVDAIVDSPMSGERFPLYDRTLRAVGGLATTLAGGPAPLAVGSGGGSGVGGMLTYLGIDMDGENIPDFNDNCPAVSNPDQLDTDGDGVGDACDNCTQVANADQRDTNGDNYGNLCDGDLNNDGVTNALDYNRLKLMIRLGSGHPSYTLDADFNGNGVVNSQDLNYFKLKLLGNPPGPSCCAP